MNPFVFFSGSGTVRGSTPGLLHSLGEWCDLPRGGRSGTGTYTYGGPSQGPKPHRPESRNLSVPPSSAEDSPDFNRTVSLLRVREVHNSTPGTSFCLLYRMASLSCWVEGRGSQSGRYDVCPKGLHHIDPQGETSDSIHFEINSPHLTPVLFLSRIRHGL